MRQRIIYILKHNPLLMKLLSVCSSFAFWVWSLFLKKDDNLVLIVSYMGLSYSDSPKVLYEYLISHPDYRNFHYVWAFENPENYPQLDAVKIDTPSYFKTALKAKYWITNTNIERGLTFKKKGQIYLNTWHAVPVKLIGNDCPGRKDFNFNTVNYLCVCGDYDERVFQTAFRAKKSSLLRCGLPRNDELWHVTEERRRTARQKLGIAEGKTVILYAPTWRDSADGGKTYAIRPPIHFNVWRERLGEEYVVLFRAHHLTTKVLGVQYDDFVRDASSYPAVNDLMIASDMLITDYSGICFDYSILCKPIFCYAYDYDTFLAERGTYFEIDDVYPNKSCRTEDELLDRIRTMDYETECRNARRFKDRFMQYGGHAVEQCANALFGGA